MHILVVEFKLIIMKKNKYCARACDIFLVFISSEFDPFCPLINIWVNYSTFRNLLIFSLKI